MENVSVVGVKLRGPKVNVKDLKCFILVNITTY